MFTVPFIRSAAERAIRTVAQTMIAVIGVDMIGVTEIAWPYVLGVSATAGLLSLLTSVAASGVGEKGTPAFIEDGR